MEESLPSNRRLLSVLVNYYHLKPKEREAAAKQVLKMSRFSNILKYDDDSDPFLASLQEKYNEKLNMNAEFKGTIEKLKIILV